MARATLHNRQDSLEQALQIFWQKGFHATSLKDLEQAMDMRPGSIYATFGSKDALFQEALDYYARMAIAELERTLSKYPSSPLQGLAAYLRLLGSLRDQALPSNACMLVKSLLELGVKEESALCKVESMLAKIESCFTTSFIESQRIGELGRQLNPVLLAQRLQAEVMGLRSFAQRKVDSSVVHEVAEAMASSLDAMRIDNVG